MENQLWNIFRETGDPMGYLLYKAEKNQKNTVKKQSGNEMKKEEPPVNTEL